VEPIEKEFQLVSLHDVIAVN
jgi:hypothetical protein